MKRATDEAETVGECVGISIHALVKRATIYCMSNSENMVISIHALVKRATAEFSYYQQLADISIHALVKRATLLKLEKGFITAISIHALVKRATHYHSMLRFRLRYFNPRPREEGDTAGHGKGSRIGNFNPRPREEGDVQPRFCAVLLYVISIHALVKRATLRHSFILLIRARFQSTPS